MTGRAVSIEDIARSAGVSHSTVSRALRDSPLISVDVRERIQQIARDMGYVPNGIAQSLQTQRTSTIGLVVTSIADPFFGEVVHGVEAVARSAGFSVILTTSHNDPEQELAAIETFHRRRVDGILVGDSRISSRYAKQLARIAVPTVLINSQAEGDSPSLHSVAIDDTTGARLAVGHLLQLGHRAIGYIGVSNRPGSNHRRLAGYQAELTAAGIVPDPAWVAVGPELNAQHEGDVATAQALLPRLWAAGISAVFCYNDMFAVGALLACRAMGLAVPGDISIVGFDDVALARYVTPPLTTVRQPMFDLGHDATRMLLDLLARSTVQNRILTPTLVERDSTAAPRSLQGE